MATLKEWRARRLLTVRGLAKAAGVAPTTVYLVETGRSIPTFRIIRALSDALGVQPEEVTEFAAAIVAVGLGRVGRGEGRSDQKVRRVSVEEDRESSPSQPDRAPRKGTPQ